MRSFVSALSAGLCIAALSATTGCTVLNLTGFWNGALTDCNNDQFNDLSVRITAIYNTTENKTFVTVSPVSSELITILEPTCTNEDNIESVTGFSTEPDGLKFESSQSCGSDTAVYTGDFDYVLVESPERQDTLSGTLIIESSAAGTVRCSVNAVKVIGEEPEEL